MFQSRLVLSFAVLLVATCVRGQAQVSCPAEITVRQQLANPVPDWKASEADIPHRLANLTFFSGPPDEHESLVNDVETKSGTVSLATWNFGKSSSRLYWLSCSYSGTTITLSKPLPAGVSSCTVSYNARQRIAGMPLIEKINCK